MPGFEPLAPLVAHGGEYLGVECLVQRCPQSVGRERGRGLEQLLRGRPHDDSDVAGHLPGVRSEALEAIEEAVAEGLGQGLLRVSLADAGHELDREQRIALGPVHDPVHERRVRIGPERIRYIAAQVVSGERSQLAALHVLEPAHLGRPRTERVAAVELVVRYMASTGSARCAGSERRREQVTARAVRPVEVLDHGQQGCLGGDACR